MALFLDTGFLIALELSSDNRHKAARNCWSNFSLAPEPLVTTSYVIDETLTFFNSRSFHAKAVEIGERLLLSRAITVIHVDQTLFREGLEFFRRHADKRYSFRDCISFVVMRKQRIGRALTFDRHFTQAGYERLPAK